MITKIKGTNDILPAGLGGDIFIAEKWAALKKIIDDVVDNFNYQFIDTPIFEATELFVKGIGDVTDIVQKEMFSFTDRGDRELTLRPEGTASIVRAYIENSIAKKSNIARLAYQGPMFRAEKPQKGRYRQFHQFGVECMGGAEPNFDVEVISLFWTILQATGLKKMKLHINTVGTEASREIYRQQLREFFQDKKDKLCSDCQNRYDSNVMRILDCKNPHCNELAEGVPPIYDSLDEESTLHYAEVKSQLNNLGISFIEDPTLVRGLDYYSKTSFEIIHDQIGAQATIVGGGRYDSLIKQSGGGDVPAVGAAFGVERLLLSIDAEGIDLVTLKQPDFFLVLLDKDKESEMSKLLFDLRNRGFFALSSDGSRQVGKQLKAADKSKSKFVVFIGGDEWNEGSLAIKNLKSGEQQRLEISPEGLVDSLAQFLNRS